MSISDKVFAELLQCAGGKKDVEEALDLWWTKNVMAYCVNYYVSKSDLTMVDDPKALEMHYQKQAFAKMAETLRVTNVAAVSEEPHQTMLAKEVRLFTIQAAHHG